MSQEEIMLVLSTIVYSKGWEKINGGETDKITISDFVWEIASGDSADVFSSSADWERIKVLVENNSSYFDNVTILNVEDNTASNGKGLDRSVCLQNNNTNETIVVFRGTGKSEWHYNADNVISNQLSGEQQRKALDYVNRMGAKYGPLIVTGHSQGGNKSQYVGILSDYVNQSFSFDGQGMSPLFMRTYKDLIEKRGHKLSLINSTGDYVSSMFYPVVGNIKYTTADKSLLSMILSGDILSVLKSHSPMAMFEKDGNSFKMRQTIADRDSLNVILNKLSTYLMLRMNKEDWEYFTNLIMHKLDADSCPIDFDESKIPEGFYLHFTEHVFGFGSSELDISGLDSAMILVLITKMMFSKKMADMQMQGNPLLDAALNQMSEGLLKSKLDSFAKKASEGEDVTRDFTLGVQDVLIKLTEEVNDESIFDIGKWDCWTRLESSFNGGITLETSQGDVNTYFKKLIDVNGTSVKQMKQIFEDVYAEDERLCSDLDELILKINSVAEHLQKEVIDNIVI